MIIEKIYNFADFFHAFRLNKFYKNQVIDAVIDVGSHKGEFINLVIKNQNLPIFSFEPQKSIRDELIHNTKDFNVKQYFDFALSDFEGKKNFFLNNLSSTSSFIKPNNKNFWIKFKKLLLGGNLNTGVQVTKVMSLDNVFDNELSCYSSILLKIDVEGYEFNVLNGAKNLIRENNINLIQIESSNYNIYKNSMNDRTNQLLNELGFSIKEQFIFPFLNFTDTIFAKKHKQINK